MRELRIPRKKHDALVVGVGKDRVTITVLDLRDGKALLGICKPASVPVQRAEVYAALHAEELEEEEYQRAMEDAPWRGEDEQP